MINNFGGFYRTEIYVHEARMLGGDVQAPCINNSRYLTRIVGKTIYLGFVHMSELKDKTVGRIADERKAEGAFASLADFVSRVPVSLEQVRLLIRVEAFRFTGKSKKTLLWEAHSLMAQTKAVTETRELFQVGTPDYELPELEESAYDDAMDEFEILGFPLSNPFALVRQLPPQTCTARQLPDRVGEQVTLNGYLVNIKQTQTARGQHMHFGTFLDTEGYFIDTVHFPPVSKQYPFRGNGCYSLSGIVEEEFGFASIHVSEMHKLHYQHEPENPALAFQPVSRSKRH